VAGLAAYVSRLALQVCPSGPWRRFLSLSGSISPQNRQLKGQLKLDFWVQNLKNSLNLPHPARIKFL
jgi:hypothetical protein